MLEPHGDPSYENGVETCHVLAALNAAVELQKRKVIVGPSDSVGIMLFNTVCVRLLRVFCISERHHVEQKFM
jgi:hypothetical protein